MRDGVEHDVVEVEVRQKPAERAGDADDSGDHRGRDRRPDENAREVAELQNPVDEKADEKAVEAGDHARFGCGERAGQDPADDQNRREQSGPDVDGRAEHIAQHEAAGRPT